MGVIKIKMKSKRIGHMNWFGSLCRSGRTSNVKILSTELQLWRSEKSRKEQEFRLLSSCCTILFGHIGQNCCGLSYCLVRGCCMLCLDALECDLALQEEVLQKYVLFSNIQVFTWIWYFCCVERQLCHLLYWIGRYGKWEWGFGEIVCIFLFHKRCKVYHLYSSKWKSLNRLRVSRRIFLWSKARDYICTSCGAQFSGPRILLRP